MAKKPKSAPTQGSATQEPQEQKVVLTTRVSIEERDAIRAAAGWGGLQRFVHEAVMAAVEKARLKTK
jgi:uncharacterized protein (DUF1778 family)